MTKSLTTFKILFGIVFFAAVAGIFYIIEQLDPRNSALNLFWFYLDLFGLIFGLAFFLGYGMRRRWGIREFAAKHFVVATRQAVWLATASVVLFFLLAAGLFNIWNAVLLAICIVFLESYFLFK